MCKTKRRINPNTLVSENAAVAYAKLILAHEGVQQVSVRTYVQPAGIQHRIRGRSSQSLISAALGRRADTDVPFWQSLMMTIQKNECVPDDLLDAALFHQDLSNACDLSRKDLMHGELDIYAKRGPVTSLDSCVQLTSKSAHLPFLDFRVQPSGPNARLVIAICRRLLPSGFIVLNSGRSYHACGVELQNSVDRIEFLAKSLLFSPIVDDRYVAHQLMQSSSALRISSSIHDGSEPEVTSVWYPD